MKKAMLAILLCFITISSCRKKTTGPEDPNGVLELLLWKAEIGENGFSSPSIGSDLTIYIQ
jgi:hypothetical protein